MTEKMTISIVLCTYNGERFLQEQLDSLSAQTRLPDEVVVGDDGSTDQTIEILEQWASEVAFPVRIQKNEMPLGKDQNLAETSLRCSGDVVFFCEQDGSWSPDKIEKMAAVLEARPEVGAVYCDGQTIERDGTQFDFRLSQIVYPEVVCAGLGVITSQTYKTPNPTASCAAVRSSLLPVDFPVWSNLKFDWRLFLKVSALTEVVTLADVLQNYRILECTAFGGPWWERMTEQKINECLQLYWTLDAYNDLAENLLKFREWLEGLPETPKVKRSIRYIDETCRHFANREKVRRNLFLHFPHWLGELFTGRYSQRSRNFECFVLDGIEGIKSALYLPTSKRSWWKQFMCGK